MGRRDIGFGQRRVAHAQRARKDRRKQVSGMRVVGAKRHLEYRAHRVIGIVFRAKRAVVGGVWRWNPVRRRRIGRQRGAEP